METRGRDRGGGEKGERQRRWGRNVWGSRRTGWKKTEEKGSWADPIPTLPPGAPQVPWLSPGSILSWRSAHLGPSPPHSLCGGGGGISSFCFVLLPGRKWLQMPWVGHSLALLTVPRFLLIPGDRASTSNELQRGAEPCSGTPCTPKKFQSRFEPRWSSGGKICLQRDAMVILVHPGLVGTCCVPNTARGAPRRHTFEKADGTLP